MSPGLVILAALAQASAPNAPVVPSVAWEVPVEDTSTPLLTGMGERFAVTTREGRITAWSAAGGAPLWQADLGSPVAAPPVFSQGRLAVAAGSVDGVDLALLDPDSGTPAARLPLGAGASGLQAAGLKSGIAVSGTFGGSPGLVLVDPTGGTARWKADLPESPSTAAAQCGETIYVGGASGALMAVSADDGSLLWQKRIGEAITTPLLCNGRRGYVGSADNRLHALRLGRRGCRRLWSHLTGGDIAGRLLLFEQRVTFFSYDTYLYTVEADNGHLAWKSRLGRRPRGESLILDRLLVVAQLNADRLESFSLPGGALGASYSLSAGSERFVTPPVRAGRLVVIAAARYGEERSRVIAIDLLGSPEAPPGSAAR